MTDKDQKQQELLKDLHEGKITVEEYMDKLEEYDREEGGNKNEDELDEEDSVRLLSLSDIIKDQYEAILKESKRARSRKRAKVNSRDRWIKILAE